MIMNYEELDEVKGGSISASLINAFSRFVTTLYDIGYALGRALGSLFKNNHICR